MLLSIFNELNKEKKNLKNLGPTRKTHSHKAGKGWLVLVYFRTMVLGF